MYYKNKNISYSQKLLNPVIKYKKSNNENDRYITKTGLKTDQKIYKNKAKITLEKYIQKEGQVFKSRKKLKENEGIKHLIISPIDPVLYNKLNKEQKKELQQIIVKQLFKNFTGYGFMGSTENKSRTIDNKTLEHFHIHIAITEKYDIKPQNIDFLKRSITNTLLKNKEIKETLGLKTKNELIKNTFVAKNKELYKNKKNEYEQIKFLFSEMLTVNKNLKNDNKKMDEIKFDIGELNNNKKKYLREIDKQKEFLLFDIKDTKKILKFRNENLKILNDEFKNTINFFKNEKDYIKKIMKNELKELQKKLNDEIKYFREVLKNEHNIYVKFLKYKLKNKKLDLGHFLYLVASNRYYIKNRIAYKNEEAKQKIKQKNDEIQNKLKELQNRLEFKLMYIKNNVKLENFKKEFDFKNLENFLEKLNKLNIKKKNTTEIYFKRINLMYTYLKIRQERFKEKLQQKKELKQKIQEKKENINNITNKYKETKNYMQDSELWTIIEKYKITEQEIIKEYNNFLKDKKIFKDIKDFKKYLETYANAKQKNTNITTIQETNDDITLR